MPKLKHKIHITSVDFYKYYAEMHFKEKVKNKTKVYFDSKYYLTKSQYTKILEKCNLKILDAILKDPLDCILPSRLGIICIRKNKPELRIDDNGNLINKMPINWKETRKLWRENPEAREQKKTIRFHNSHSNQYVGKFVWKTKQSNFKNKSAYCFKPCRTATQNLAKIFQDEDREIDYFLKEY